MERSKDVMALKPGDRIRVGPGRLEKVVSATEPGDYGTCTIHTDLHDITTTLPCAVQVVDR